MPMIIAADLPDVIPVFPLPGALMLPRARLPLHIFEPRYLAMIEDCMKTKHRLIGMIQPRETPGGEKRLQAIGCAGRLTGFSETEDGRYMITLSGASRYRVREEVQGFTPYRRCLVDWAPFARDLGPTEDDPGFRRGDFMGLLGRYFTKLNLSTDWDSLKEAEPELLINSLSMLCPFSPEDKQALLEAPTLVTRRETMVTLIEFALRGSGEEEILQ
jgi:uncharacterized protein